MDITQGGVERNPTHKAGKIIKHPQISYTVSLKVLITLVDELMFFFVNSSSFIFY